MHVMLAIVLAVLAVTGWDRQGRLRRACGAASISLARQIRVRALRWAAGRRPRSSQRNAKSFIGKERT